MKHAILVLLILAVAACSASDTENPEMVMPVPGEDVDEMEEHNMDDDDMVDDDSEMMDDSETMNDDMSEPDVTFVLTGENFAFFQDGQEAPELVVNEGDLVRVEFTSTQGFHDWVVDEFDAATEKVQAEGSTFVEFVADQTGTFEYYCSVGSHRANGMVGNLVVQ